jgi:hypothetical protein
MTKPHRPKPAPKAEPAPARAFDRTRTFAEKHWWKGLLALIGGALLTWLVPTVCDAVLEQWKDHEAFQRQLIWRVIPQHYTMYSNTIPDILVRLDRLEAFTNSLNNPPGSSGSVKTNTTFGLTSRE